MAWSAGVCGFPWIELSGESKLRMQGMRMENISYLLLSKNHTAILPPLFRMQCCPSSTFRKSLPMGSNKYPTRATRPHNSDAHVSKVFIRLLATLDIIKHREYYEGLSIRLSFTKLSCFVSRCLMEVGRSRT